MEADLHLRVRHIGGALELGNRPVLQNDAELHGDYTLEVNVVHSLDDTALACRFYIVSR